MIKGNILNSENLSDNPKIQKGIDSLKSLDFTKIENGHYEIDGDDLFINVVEIDTSPAATRAPEAHDKYADIHMVIKGEEAIGMSVRDDALIAEDLRDKEDAVLYGKDVKDTLVNLHEGDFLVCMPQDTHRPGCCIDKPMHIRKAIVKVRV